MDDYVARGEYEECVKRLEKEDERQNQRLKILEEDVHEISELTASVKELAVEMKNMTSELDEQGDRLKALEGRDGEMWRKVVSYIITAALGILVGYLFKQFGIV